MLRCIVYGKRLLKLLFKKSRSFRSANKRFNIGFLTKKLDTASVWMLQHKLRLLFVFNRQKKIFFCLSNAKSHQRTFEKQYSAWRKFIHRLNLFVYLLSLHKHLFLRKMPENAYLKTIKALNKRAFYFILFFQKIFSKHRFRPAESLFHP